MVGRRGAVGFDIMGCPDERVGCAGYGPFRTRVDRAGEEIRMDGGIRGGKEGQGG